MNMFIYVKRQYVKALSEKLWSDFATEFDVAAGKEIAISPVGRHEKSQILTQKHPLPKGIGDDLNVCIGQTFHFSEGKISLIRSINFTNSQREFISLHTKYAPSSRHHTGYFFFESFYYFLFKS